MSNNEEDNNKIDKVISWDYIINETNKWKEVNSLHSPIATMYTTRLLDEIISENKKINTNVLSYLTRNENITSSETKRKNKRNAIIRKIRRHYKDESLVLVLGAGISLDYGLPSWSELLQRVLSKIIENNNNSNQVSLLFNAVLGPNPLITARYLKLNFNDTQKSFECAIRDALYEKITQTPLNNTYAAITKLCISPGRKPKLDAVITYNYDDILEKNIDRYGLDVKYRSIYSLGINPEKHELPIYHVHGFLPREGNVNENNNIVLSDDTYHKQYADLYHWSNLVQLNKFKDSNCLFIGHSFTDPNLRRLLDIAKAQRGNNLIQHYIVKKKYHINNLIKEIETLIGVDDKFKEIIDEAMIEKIAEQLINIVHDFEESDAKSFGLEILWIDDYPDISKVLEEVSAKT